MLSSLLTVCVAGVYRFGHGEVMFHVSKLLALLVFGEEMCVAGDGSCILLPKSLKLRYAPA